MATSTKFQPGQSGNPKGRPAGSRNRITIACEKILDGEAKAITKKAVAMAKSGDTVALRLCLERIIPPRKGMPVRFAVPTLTNSGDVRAAALAVLQAVADGQISPEEGNLVSSLIETARRSIETDELGSRLEALEKALEARRR